MAWALLLLIAIPTAWMGSRQIRLEVDPQNRALKSIGTREEADIERQVREFGSDQTLLLGFQAAPGLAMAERDVAQLHRIAAAVRSLSGVQGVSPIQRPDEGFALLTVTLPTAAASRDPHAVMRQVLETAQDACGPNLRMRATGQPLIEAEIAHSVENERGVIVLWIVITLLVLLSLCYRSLLVPLVVLLPTGFGILWTGGLLQWLGYRLNPLLVLLDPLLLTVGVAGSVHLVEAYRRLHPTHGPRVAAAVREDLWRPMLLTTLTSMVGFLSLLISPLPAVKTFGVFAALGVAMTSAFAIWTVPTWMFAFVGAPGDGRRSRHVIHYAAWLHTRAGRVVVSTVILLSALLFHGSTARIDNNPLKILSAESTVRRDTEWLSSRIGGIETFGVLIPEDRVAAEPQLVPVVALELGGQALVAGVVTPPIQSASGAVLVQAVLRPSGSEERETLFDRIEEFLTDLGAPDAHVTGTAVQVARDSGNLIRGQIWSLLLVIPLLCLAVAIGLRSWRLGLVSLLPNALPCILLYGAMAALDRTLSVATVMIGVVMMGLIVDDTIHLLHGFQVSRARGCSRGRSVNVALRKTARPITITSIVLFSGFAVGGFGSLTTTVEFSLLASCTIAMAWILDVLILPAILLMPRLRRSPPAPLPQQERTA